MTSPINIDETDEWGYTLLARDGPIELFSTPKEYFAVYLWVNQDEYFTVVRKDRDDANRLFDSVRDMIRR